MALIKVFLSTPSARRATDIQNVYQVVIDISIHALREEGDDCGDKNPSAAHISIHALREEGDAKNICYLRYLWNFYPRPPRGGRRFNGTD